MTETDEEYSHTFKRNNQADLKIALINPPDIIADQTEDNKEQNISDKEKALPHSVQTERVTFNPFKESTKPSQYFEEENARSTPTEKYAYYSKHSFNVKEEMVWFHYDINLETKE